MTDTASFTTMGRISTFQRGRKTLGMSFHCQFSTVSCLLNNTFSLLQQQDFVMLSSRQTALQMFTTFLSTRASIEDLSSSTLPSINAVSPSGKSVS